MIKNLISLVIVIVLFSCQQSKIEIPDQSAISGLASVIQLQPEETNIVLQDYFTDVLDIDSVSFPKGLKGELSGDRRDLLLKRTSQKLAPLSILNVWSKGFPYFILMKRSNKENVEITYNADNMQVGSVQIAGEMNGWNPKASPMIMENGIWTTEFLLNPGNYQYQLVVDGEWILDPANPDSVDNNNGGFNSLLRVGKNNNELRPRVFTEAVESVNISIGSDKPIDRVFVFWQNYLLPMNDMVVDKKHIIFRVPSEAKKLKRSFMRVFAYNRYGVSNDLLIPLEKGEVIYNVDELSRNDWESAVFYFLMVDRFNNGNLKNDKKVDDPEILPKANFFGGDLAGVTKKIKDGYFEDLGINTIWLSPITQNPLGAYGLWPEPRTKFSGYHGYWPISSSNVDFRFGTADELHELVDLAHKHNLNVILDYVANHVHELHPVYLEHPDWVTNLYLPDGSLNTEKWDEYRLTTWFDVFLPTLDLSRPEVVEPMTDSALFWLTEFHLDGFRHDATKHIPELFWRTLTEKVKNRVAIPENKRVYQIGETYGNPELISSYVGSGMLDGQFDFNVYDDAVAVFAKEDASFENLAASLQESFEYYGYHNLMGYISGNQDRARFISYAGGAVSFAEDAKLAGWTRDIGVGDPIAYKKLQMLNAFNMTIPGIPTIYYGDEFGMPGANDPDNRRMMQFENLNDKEKQTLNITKKLVQLRRNNLPLIYGDFQVLELSEKTFVYARTYFDKIVVVAFNKSDEERTVEFNIPERFKDISLKSNFGSDFQKDGSQIKVVLAGNSFEVLIN
jgi:glycosidase